MAAASWAAERRVTRTPLRARVWAPIAADSVNVAGSATGIEANSAVRARRTTSARGQPVAAAYRTMRTATLPFTTARLRVAPTMAACSVLRACATRTRSAARPK
jgi:hypothetical protein